ncbi:MAG: hypothetical protein IPI07_00480 [Flavobacteriales bacterium]|nr:hypothetical protein [Flavobacteriales bacterium]
MEPRNTPFLSAGLLVALVLPFGIAQAATPPSSPPTAAASEEAVVITGWLQVEGLTMKDVIVEVEVNGTTRIAPVSETGRFTVELPANAEVLLRFEKPGHLSKEVTVDTRYAGNGKGGQKKRHVKFGVIMELERWMGGLTYAGPVGSIGFDQGGGCLAVEHDRTMVPAEQRRPMVF